MRFVNLRTAIALGAAMALGVGAAFAANGDSVVIPAYFDGNVVSVLVEAVVDPDSQEWTEVDESGIANDIYLIFDDTYTLNNGTDESGNPAPSHVLTIATGNPGGGDTYNPYWDFYAVLVTNPSVLPLMSEEAVLAALADGDAKLVVPGLVTYALASGTSSPLGYDADVTAYVLCPEITTP